jgi:hypothetical protein
MDSRKRRAEDHEQLYLHEVKRPKVKAECYSSEEENFDAGELASVRCRLTRQRIELDQERSELEQRERKLAEEEEVLISLRRYIVEQAERKLAREEENLSDLTRALVIEREEFTREQEKLVSDARALGQAKRNLTREKEEFAREKDRLEALKQALKRDFEEIEVLRLTQQQEKARLQSSSRVAHISLKNGRDEFISEYGRRNIVGSGEHSGKDSNCSSTDTPQAIHTASSAPIELKFQAIKDYDRVA